jgi:beta-phosphoglucomutase-like phosphatase (HAD superfamily)
VSGPGVVFDMDGVLVDSEPLWVLARQDLVHAAGGQWLAEAETAMMGISSDRAPPAFHLPRTVDRPGAHGRAALVCCPG